MEVEAWGVGSGHPHHSAGRPRGMLGGSPTAASAPGASPGLGSAPSPLLPTSPSSSISIFTVSVAGDYPSKSSNSPHYPPTSTPSNSPYPNNASPRAQGPAKATSVTAASPSSRNLSDSPRPPPLAVIASPSIAAKNARRLSTPHTPSFRPSPLGHQRSAPSPSAPSCPTRRNSNRLSSPSNPTPLQRDTMASPPRRQRVESSVKLLPPLYQHCHTDDLAVLISDMLGELVVLNDQIPLSTGGLTRFHSRAPPTISIPDYLSRLTLHSSLQPSILLSMVYYIDILSTLYPTFTISSLTVHRFLITAATVASKGLCDSFLTNSFYARVGGVSLMELNLLELEFLTRVGWRIVPRGEVLKEYYRSLVGRMSVRYGIDESAVGGRNFVGQIAGQLMAGEILPVTQAGGTTSALPSITQGHEVSSPGGTADSQSVGTSPAELQGGEG